MEIDDLRETAALARLNLDESELAAALPAFEQMLAFFADMQAADEDTDAFPVPISGLSRTVRAVSSGHFRADNAGSPHTTLNSLTGDADSAALLDNAGEQDGRFIVIPNVL
ncbi:MAG: aspartyl/glutamyl-tRNA amidotransferase subunit C [Treponema sp.]|jgi:aspartyl-tRNA(Asn)/glutamyl-tRNA(Gln) amidotransferase subunit C|nr:aspartyl/glutamyl-tRNA amidotransferase subunit C [Treponema sp.]